MRKLRNPQRGFVLFQRVHAQRQITAVVRNLVACCYQNDFHIHALLDNIEPVIDELRLDLETLNNILELAIERGVRFEHLMDAEDLIRRWHQGKHRPDWAVIDDEVHEAQVCLSILVDNPEHIVFESNNMYDCIDFQAGYEPMIRFRGDLAEALDYTSTTESWQEILSYLELDDTPIQVKEAA